MRAEMTTEQRELIEEFGLLQEQMGGTRMTGRVSGWLLLSDPPVQSLTEIADGLGVSKAAVSGAARLLLQGRFVERVGEPGQRGDFYRALPADPDERPAHRPRPHPAPADRRAACRPSPAATRRSPTTRSCAISWSSPRSSRPELPELLARWRERRTTGVTDRRRRGRRRSHHRHWRHHLSWLTKISLRNRSIVGLAVLAVLLVGAFAITSLKQELIPDLTFPYLTVFTVDQGVVAEGRGAQRDDAARAGGQDLERRQGVRLVLQRRHEHHHHRVRVRHRHEGQGGRGPAGRVGRAADAARHRAWRPRSRPSTSTACRSCSSR